MIGYDTLPTTEKINLLRGLSHCLPKREAGEARATAWTMEVAEKQQLKFRDVLIDPPKQA